MLKRFIVAAALSAGLATAAFAGPADDAVKARIDCMKANGAGMGVFVPVLKGEKAFDAAAHKTATDAIAAACAGWAGWWKPEFKKGETLESWAKDEVFTDMTGFEASSAGYTKAFTALAAATDDASFKAAFGPFGASCKDCHEKYRRPKE
jgi:cytochrome c556